MQKGKANPGFSWRINLNSNNSITSIKPLMKEIQLINLFGLVISKLDKISHLEEEA